MVLKLHDLIVEWLCSMEKHRTESVITYVFFGSRRNFVPRLSLFVPANHLSLDMVHSSSILCSHYHDGNNSHGTALVITSY